MSINIPLGTYVQDGVRTGPIYTGRLPIGGRADINGVITSGSAKLQYGPGILLSPNVVYSIVPNPPNADAGFTLLNNLVAETTPVVAGNLSLIADDSVTFVKGQSIQLDVPRIVAFEIIGDPVVGAPKLTIFGTDWYGDPMQETHELVGVEAGVYPVVTLGEEVGNNGTISDNRKAFYTINRVYLSAGLGGGTSISLGCADIYGLPYYSDTFGQVMFMSEGEDSLIGVFIDEPGGPFTTFAKNTTAGFYGAGAPIDTPQTANSSDTRGLFAGINSADGVSELIVGYYVPGADVWTNQKANQQENSRLNYNGQTFGAPIAPLTEQSLYGATQYYTGVPD